MQQISRLLKLLRLAEAFSVFKSPLRHLFVPKEIFASRMSCLHPRRFFGTRKKCALRLFLEVMLSAPFRTYFESISAFERSRKNR